MLGLDAKYLNVLYAEYFRDSKVILGNVGWAYDLLRSEILNRFSKEEIKQVNAWLNEEVEKYRLMMESIKNEDPEYYAKWHMHDLPIDRTNLSVQYQWKDRVVKHLFKKLRDENIKSLTTNPKNK